MKFQWIHEHRDQPDWTVDVMCSTLSISRSGYYAWTRRKPSKQAQRKVELLAAARTEYELGRCNYGSPRVHQALNEKGIKVCLNTVAKLMNEAGMAAKCCRRFCVHTTDSRHDYRPAENLLDQPRERFATKDQAKRMTFEYIEVFYNRQRRHSAIGYISPEAFEASRN